ncbi:GNAT family N-acetyltransferase [Photobacterium atrarenae]|uniref:N-acetyltransferase n=1 Tax=Photobacterium atrarenae TaxID=865757 RepID=A0ABY5GPR8_9GAMM|nr:N-acetyltransferase [Photobacterium atrarenae]UTV30537.1 N-acetyltransferase [Photobacterium atrarenae]
MHCSTFDFKDSGDVIQLFTRVFSDSETAQEGQLIGHLVSELIATTAPSDLQGFVATVNEQIVACIYFSRLTLSNQKNAFILSPVAVATEHQRQGIGRKLISFGLEVLRKQGVDWVFTYGDPNYYARAGFSPISETAVKAPLPLTYPEGWLAQSLTADKVEASACASACVAALNQPQYW